jgi:hypothetical protein
MVAEPGREHVLMPYLVIEYDKGPNGLEGMQSLINAKAAEGYELLQVVRCSTYEWVLFFRREPMPCPAG